MAREHVPCIAKERRRRQVAFSPKGEFVLCAVREATWDERNPSRREMKGKFSTLYSSCSTLDFSRIFPHDRISIFAKFRAKKWKLLWKDQFLTPPLVIWSRCQSRRRSIWNSLLLREKINLKNISDWNFDAGERTVQEKLKKKWETEWIFHFFKLFLRKSTVATFLANGVVQ